MTRQRTSKRHVGVSWSDAQIRHHSAEALRYAMRKELAVQVDVASWNEQSARAVGKQLAEEVIPTLKILKSGRLRRHILEYLQVCDQRVRKTLPREPRRRAR